jgi:NADH-quinone oxidoreductase subunit M
VVIIASWNPSRRRNYQYMASFPILSGLMISVFAAYGRHAVLRVLKYALIPMYLIIGVWGRPNKISPPSSSFLYAAGLVAHAGLP